MARKTRWIELLAARWEIYEKRLDEHFSNVVLDAMRLANTLLLNEIREGRLPSKPEDPQRFNLTWTAPGEQQSFTLEPDGTIPLVFWQHHAFAWEEQERQPFLLASTYEPTDWAKLDTIEGASFRYMGRDNGVMQGSTGGPVLIERKHLRDILPRGGGRPKGAGSYENSDRPLAMRALEHQKKTGCSQRSAAEKFAPEALGGGTLDSKTSRLVDRMRILERGK